MFRIVLLDKSLLSSNSKGVHHLFSVRLLFHIDEIDDDDASAVSNLQLVGNLDTGLEIGFKMVSSRSFLPT